MKNAFNNFLKVFTTALLVTLTTLAASPFALILWGVAFVYPLGPFEIIVFVPYVLGFAAGIHLSKGIWSE